MNELSRLSHGPLPVRRRRAEADQTAPDGAQIRLLAGPADGARRCSVCEALLPAGQVSRPLRHRTVEEVWYVLEGDGRVWRCPPGGAAASSPPQAVSSGDTVVVPVGWGFQFAAAAGGPLRFLCLTTPPWPGPEEAEPAGPGGLGPPTV